MAQTIGVRDAVPQGWVRCTSQRCEYIGSAPEHAHPREEGDRLRMGCGVMINRNCELNMQAEAFVLAMSLPPHELLALAQKAHEDRKTEFETILRLSLALISSEPVFKEA